MRFFGSLIVILALAGSAKASWYWPFGDEGGVQTQKLRISELMEPASLLIDEAADLAAEKKTNEAVEKYRKALEELDRIETENPDRAKSTEFATLRNKRAYVNAAIDSLLLAQVKANAKAVAVSDTTELEKRLAEEKAKAAGKSVALRTRAMKALAEGDFVVAESLIESMLAERPNGAVALNLKSALCVKRGDYKGAEAALDQAIRSNPRSHFAYYNMANLKLLLDPADKTNAKRYYVTGRDVGGPADARLEEALR